MATVALSAIDFKDDLLEEMKAMLDAQGFDIVENAGRSADDAIAACRDADGAITSYGDFDAGVFEALPNLKVLSRTGTGVDNIDIAAATANGTIVCNVPDYGTEPVSDHAVALVLAVLRRIPESNDSLKSGVWGFQRFRPLGQISGRSLGVVGMGHIGSEVARKAAGLGFKVLCWDRRLTPNTVTPEGYTALALDELLRSADAVSFHTALTSETRHLLNAQRIASMKKDAIVVNTSRGAIVDTDALAAALEAGHLWGAGLDVFETEPLPPDSPIAHAPRTVLTPHSAYWSEESAHELMRRSTQAVIDALEGRLPHDTLNPQAWKTKGA